MTMIYRRSRPIAANAISRPGGGQRGGVDVELAPVQFETLDVGVIGIGRGCGFLIFLCRHGLAHSPAATTPC